MSRRFVIGVGALALLAACRGLLGPDALPVLLEAEVDAVEVDSARQRVHARLLFTIHNQRPVPVRYLPCNHVVLRDSADTWRAVGRAPVCIESSLKVELVPGRQQTDMMDITLGEGLDAGPPHGTFRLATYIFGPESSTADFKMTQPFRVIVP